MCEWQPEHDVEIREVYAGCYGANYEQVLIEDALRYQCEQILQPYWDKKETVDAVLAKIEKLQPEPAPVVGLGTVFAGYKQLLADSFRNQWGDQPEILNPLLAQFEK